MGYQKFKGNVVKYSWWFFLFDLLNFRHQLEEELGSAEEQPTSNKVDAYTVILSGSNMDHLIY